MAPHRSPLFHFIVEVNSFINSINQTTPTTTTITMQTVISLLLLIAIIINSGPCCVYSLKAKAHKGKYEEETTIFNDTTLVNDNINIGTSATTTVPDAAVVDDYLDNIGDDDGVASVEFVGVGGDDKLTAMPSENADIESSIAPSTLAVDTATPSMNPSAPLLSTNLPSVEPTSVPSVELSDSLQPSVRNTLFPVPSLRKNATATAAPSAIISTRTPSATTPFVINNGMNSTESPSFQPVMNYPTTQLEVVEESETSIPSSQPSDVLKEKDLSPSAVSNNTASTEPPVRVRNGTAVKVEDQSNTGLLGALLSVSLCIMIGVGIVAFQKYSSKKKKEATPPPPTRTDHVIYRPSEEEKKRVKAKEERKKIRHKLALEALESRKNGHRMSDASRQRLVEELAKSPAMDIRGYINPMSA